MKAHLTDAFSFPGKNSQAPDSGEQKLDYALLGERVQEAVKDYFAAAANLVQTIKAIRERQAAVDVDSVLDIFEQAERAYIWAGMRTFFPPALYCVSSFDVERLISKGLLSRLDPGEVPVLYAPGMRIHIPKLIVKHEATEYDSNALNHLF